MGLIKIIAVTAMLAPLAGIGLVTWQSHGSSGASERGKVEQMRSSIRSAGELSPSSPALVIPVQGVLPSQLSDTFSQARSGGRLHDAIDIMAPRGTPVIAAAPGRVEKLFRSRDGGNTVYLRSSDRRTIHYYAHLDAYASGLTEGAFLNQRAVLGTVGSTGNASPDAPHLHFEIVTTRPAARWWEPGKAVNPYPLFFDGRASSREHIL